jgi:L-ascorbate 6-phosphate lactonase
LWKAMRLKPEIAILPINGEFGNLNSIDAAILTHELRAKILIPCHFWTFAFHKGDPSVLIKEFNQCAPESRLVVLAQGEMFEYGKKGDA